MSNGMPFGRLDSSVSSVRVATYGVESLVQVARAQQKTVREMLLDGNIQAIRDAVKVACGGAPSTRMPAYADCAHITGFGGQAAFQPRGSKSVRQMLLDGDVSSLREALRAPQGHGRVAEQEPMPAPEALQQASGLQQTASENSNSPPPVSATELVVPDKEAPGGPGASGRPTVEASHVVQSAGPVVAGLSAGHTIDNRQGTIEPDSEVSAHREGEVLSFPSDRVFAGVMSVGAGKTTLTERLRDTYHVYDIDDLCAIDDSDPLDVAAIEAIRLREKLIAEGGDWGPYNAFFMERAKVALVSLCDDGVIQRAKGKSPGSVLLLLHSVSHASTLSAQPIVFNLGLTQAGAAASDRAQGPGGARFVKLALMNAASNKAKNQKLWGSAQQSCGYALSTLRRLGVLPRIEKSDKDPTTIRMFRDSMKAVHIVQQNIQRVSASNGLKEHPS